MKKIKKNMIFGSAEHKRKDHNQCNQNMYWRDYSSVDILDLEFDLLEKLWKIEGMI